MSATVSIYNNIFKPAESKEIPVDILLQYIHEGQWQDDVLAVRTGKKDKVKLPAACMSGKFKERQMSGLIQHSGFICIDIDDVDPEELKSLLCSDKYVYAAFVSAGGKGLALMVKINPDKHAEAFEGLQEYLFTNYQVVVDPSCRDVSRARFVSYDPYMFLNEKAEKFCHYPKKLPAALKKVPEVVFVKSDFDTIVQEIVARHLDITDGYSAWLRVGFAIADKFQEAGRNYFHQVSQFNQDYTYDTCDRQYTNCLKANKTGITIASFYHFAKQAGIQTISEQTKKIANVARNIKKSGSSQAEAIKVLQEVDGIPREESEPIISQVFAGAHVTNDDSIITQVEDYLRYNYEFKKNLITRHVEKNGAPMSDWDMNTIWKECAKVFDKMPKSVLEDIINSDFTKTYNPLHDFFEQYKERRPSGIIKELFSCVETDTGMQGEEFCPDYLDAFGTKWLVGIISSIFGKHSPLMLVFTGKQGNGKTEFFRRLLPDELQAYFAESKMQAGKDDEMLMACRLVLMDDELSGKNKRDEAKMKYLLSKNIITLREPFGRRNVDLKRLAVFCGTTNDQEVLNDPTGNRRIIPVNVVSIDYARINKIDRIDLMMEAYWLWKDGFKWELSGNDIAMLNKNTSSFEQFSTEYEMIMRYYRLPKKPSEAVARTATDIATALHRITGNSRLNKDTIVKELRRIGFDGSQKHRVEGYDTPRRAYLVYEVTHNDGFLCTGL